MKNTCKAHVHKPQLCLHNITNVISTNTPHGTQVSLGYAEALQQFCVDLTKFECSLRQTTL